MSEDPKRFDAGDYNLFRYCHNDPIDFTDPMGTLEQYHAELAHSPDRLWDMTKWFDRSNIIQGNFPGFGYMSAQSDRDAKGGHGNFFSRLIHSLFGRHKRTANIGPTGGRENNSTAQHPNSAGSSAIERAMALRGTRDGNRTDTERGGLYITHYGYPDDPAGDSRRVNRIGNHGNLLNDDSVALSSDLRLRFEIGARIFVNGRYMGHYDDSAPYSRGVIDIFDPRGRAGGEEWGRTIESGQYSITTD